jgi:hypothetical protein
VTPVKGGRARGRPFFPGQRRPEQGTPGTGVLAYEEEICGRHRERADEYALPSRYPVTEECCRLVLMPLWPGAEVHDDVGRFFRLAAGGGGVVIAGARAPQGRQRRAPSRGQHLQNGEPHALRDPLASRAPDGVVRTAGAQAERQQKYFGVKTPGDRPSPRPGGLPGPGAPSDSCPGRAIWC